MIKNQPFTVHYQHNDFVVIDKPIGMSVHKDQEQQGLTALVAEQLDVEKVWLVHRLDKVTSGLLILALNQPAASELSQLFASHSVRKTYWALAAAKPKKKQGKIIGDMAKARNGAWKLCHTQNNPAITTFTSSSVEPHLRHFVLMPATGKTHQLRVTLKSLGSPIIGDDLYGGEMADRVYLHAYQLDFCYQGQSINIQCLPTQGILWQKLRESSRF